MDKQDMCRRDMRASVQLPSVSRVNNSVINGIPCHKCKPSRHLSVELLWLF